MNLSILTQWSTWLKILVLFTVVGAVMPGQWITFISVALLLVQVYSNSRFGRKLLISKLLSNFGIIVHVYTLFAPTHTFVDPTCYPAVMPTCEHTSETHQTWTHLWTGLAIYVKVYLVYLFSIIFILSWKLLLPARAPCGGMLHSYVVLPKFCIHCIFIMYNKRGWNRFKYGTQTGICIFRSHRYNCHFPVLRIICSSFLTSFTGGLLFGGHVLDSSVRLLVWTSSSQHSLPYDCLGERLVLVLPDRSGFFLIAWKKTYVFVFSSFSGCAWLANTRYFIVCRSSVVGDPLRWPCIDR